MSKDVYQDMLSGLQWSETRARIIFRARGRCEQCGRRSARLEVHHMRYIGNHPSDTPDEYLIALCRECHAIPHWLDRLERYSAHKRRLLDQGIELTPELWRALIDHYEV